ncbi:hypothetical protein PPYR_10244 [Photinus pyralis]|uniref:Uncharacterized protein n=1 Tax=Photinus pyralis TaxID=7054 RepID=A0A5N4AFU7_PHOPY|nr:hypothetical protein PPYR_10244 [Photinus pyralis]
MLPSENCDECWNARDLIGFLIENCGVNEMLPLGCVVRSKVLTSSSTRRNIEPLQFHQKQCLTMIAPLQHSQTRPNRCRRK